MGKKKSNSSKQKPNCTSKHKEYDTKIGKVIFISIVTAIVFMFAYNWLFKIITLRVYSPYYFASEKFLFGNLFITYPVVFICIFAVMGYFPSGRKISNKKYIRIATITISVALIITVICSCRVWVFDENSFTYTTLFQRNKVVYDYNDIESVDLNFEQSRYTTSLIYTFKMNDGTEIEVSVSESYCKDDKKILEFDNMISSKRRVIGDYGHFGRKSDAFNEYYRTLFKMQGITE